MMDQMSQLEACVETLIRALEDQQLKAMELKEENLQLARQLHELEAIKLRNDQLATQVEHLEGEIEGMSAKEGQVRERLQSILSRIDTIVDQNKLESAPPAQA